MAEDLTATLGVDGKKFVEGIEAIAAGATKSMRAVGKRFGAQIVAGFTMVLGLSFLNRMIGETQRWAKDTAAVREEYEKMGVVVTDEFAGKMAEAGRQFTLLGYQWKALFLPVIGGLAASAMQFLQYIKEAAHFWKYMYEHDIQPKVQTAVDFWYMFATEMGKRGSGSGATGKETNWEVVKRAWDEASRFVGSESPASNTLDSFTQAGAEMNSMSDAFDEMMSKLKLATSGTQQTFSLSRSGGGSRLASIGGDVGGLNDRVMRIEQEQVRILKQIASNTKAKSQSIGLEIPTS